jgi:hypothetical protein
LPGVDWLVFIDGLDELVDSVQRSKVLYSLSAYLGNPNSHMRIVVASRALPVGELAELRQNNVCELLLCPFGQDDVRDFARKWFISRSDTLRDGQQIEDEVDKFMTSVRTSGLTAMVRLPLLATIAVLVYEHKHGATLPRSRTALYTEFATLLLSARKIESGKSDHGLASGPLARAALTFSAWLPSSIDELLLTLATAQVFDSACSLMKVACGWVRENALKGIASDAGESVWTGALLNNLIATSLFIVRDSEVEFLHQSVAEYIAAGQRAQSFDMKNWHIQISNPATRSLALFVLARSDCSPDAAVEMLLEYQTDDPISAGYVLTDGAALDVGLQNPEFVC